MAWLIFGLGLFSYALIAAFLLVLDVLNPDQGVFATAVTLPTDRALALLALSATVLIALVATLWAGQLLDAGLSRGRRRALTAVTSGTGVGNVIVGVAGALHRPDEGWNFITVAIIVMLSLVLAYVAADVAFFIMEDRNLDKALRRQDVVERRARLQIARRNWLRLSRAALWNRGKHPVGDRLRQTAIVFGALTAVLSAVLIVVGGRHAVTDYLGWLCLDVAVGLVVGQLAAHYITVKFVARRWEPLLWFGLYGLMYLVVSLLAQLQLLSSMLENLPDTWLADLLVVLASWLLPPLLCLFGLTVVPRRWRRLRPLRQIRWSVISAIGREIELVDKSLSSGGQPTRPPPASGLVRAIRQTTGADEIGPSAPG